MTRANSVSTYRPVLNMQDFELLSIIKQFGYVDKFFLQEFLTPGSKKRYYYHKRRQLIEHKYLEVFGAFFPPEITPTDRESYSVFMLGSQGLKATVEGHEDLISFKRTKDVNAPQLAHSCMLARSVMEIKRTLELSEFTIVSILNESGQFNEVIGIQPDATIIFATKTTPVQLGAIYIEAERNYVDQKKIEKKVTRYYNAIKNKRFNEIFDLQIGAHRVVYVCNSQNKAEDLTKKASLIDLKDSGVTLLITSYQELCTEKNNTVYSSPLTSISKRRLTGISK